MIGAGGPWVGLKAFWTTGVTLKGRFWSSRLSRFPGSERSNDGRSSSEDLGESSTSIQWTSGDDGVSRVAATWPRLRGRLQSSVWRVNSGREFEPSSEEGCLSINCLYFCAAGYSVHAPPPPAIRTAAVLANWLTKR